MYAAEVIFISCITDSKTHFVITRKNVSSFSDFGNRILLILHLREILTPYELLNRRKKKDEKNIYYNCKKFSFFLIDSVPNFHCPGIPTFKLYYTYIQITINEH